MKSYKKPKITKEDFIADGEDDYSLDDFKYTPDPLFSLGQVYEKHAVFKIKCSKCGGDKFNIGHHSYLTVALCLKCKTEFIMHDG